MDAVKRVGLRDQWVSPRCLVGEIASPLPVDLTRADDLHHQNLLPLLHKIWIACHILRLGTEARFASTVLLHRYYAAQTAQDDNHTWKSIGAACLVLGCKMGETSRRLRDVVNTAHMLDFSLYPVSGVLMNAEPPELNEAYWKAKEDLISAEQAVLRVLKFDVHVSHPHRLASLLVEESFEPHEQADTIAKAWEHLNQAAFCSTTLRHSAHDLARAAVWLALPPANRKKIRWKKAPTRQVCEDLCSTIKE